MHVIAAMLIASHLLADEPKRASEVVSADNCKQVEIQLDFSSGSIEVAPADMTELVKLDVYYTPRDVRYDVEKTTRGDKCIVFLKSDRRRGWGKDDGTENEWTLRLSRRYPTSLEMNIGACEGKMDLGGIPLTGLTLDVGAADLEIDFSAPNPTPFEDFSVDCGASSLKFLGLANANARTMEFDVGAGSCEADLRGEIKGQLDLDVSVGVGSMDLIVSRGVALRVEGGDNWFSSIEFHGLDLEEIRDGVWETDDFSHAENRIVISADVAMGSVDIYARR